MGSDKTDINHPISIIDPYHQAIFVSGNIKDNPSILKDAGIFNPSNLP